MHNILKSTLHRQCSCPKGKECSRCIRTKTLKRSKYRSRTPNETSTRRNKLCQWYARRKALNDLKSLHRKERQAENERRLDLEREKRMRDVLEYWNRSTSEDLPSGKIERKVQIRKSGSLPPHRKSRPQAFIEEPRRLPIALVLKHYTENPTTVQLLDRQLRWKSRHKSPDYTPVKRQTLHKWYTHRRTVKDLKTHNDKEEKIKDKDRTERAGLKKDFEVYDLMRQRSESLPPSRVEKKVHMKKRSASVKPRSASRYVTVKRHNRNDSLSQRCANCFYRMCCRCYCYFTCIFLVVFFVICII